VGGGDWLKTSYGGKGWLKTSVPLYGGRESKIAQKNRHMIFERSLIVVVGGLLAKTQVEIADKKTLYQKKDTVTKRCTLLPAGCRTFGLGGFLE